VRAPDESPLFPPPTFSQSVLFRQGFERAGVPLAAGQVPFPYNGGRRIVVIDLASWSWNHCFFLSAFRPLAIFWDGRLAAMPEKPFSFPPRSANLLRRRPARTGFLFSSLLRVGDIEEVRFSFPSSSVFFSSLTLRYSPTRSLDRMNFQKTPFTPLVPGTGDEHFFPVPWLCIAASSDERDGAGLKEDAAPLQLFP